MESFHRKPINIIIVNPLNTLVLVDVTRPIGRPKNKEESKSYRQLQPKLGP